MGDGAGPSLPPPSPSWKRVAIAIGVAAILLVSGSSIYWTETRHQSGGVTQPPPPPGWTTYLRAWDSVSTALSSIANGTWTLRFAEGAAATSRWAPPAVLWAETYPVAWARCAAQLSGVSTLTFWNYSVYPNSSVPNVFTSGAAPLWTFVFNGSGTPTFVATWFSGRVLVNAALPPTSPCFDSGLGLDRVFTGLPRQPVPLTSYVDSDVIARAARNAGLLPQDQPGEFALYFPAEQVVPDRNYGGATWTIDSGSCGSPGELGANFTLTESWYNGTTGTSGFSWGESSWMCADAYYLLNLTAAPFVPPFNSTGIYREWNLSWSFLSSAIPATWTNGSLNTSMLQLWADGGGSPFAAVCSSPASNLSSCVPPSAGWYAVLEGPTGALLDSYPSATGGTHWTTPGVVVSPDDHLVLVGAAGLAPTTFLRTLSTTEPLVFGWPS